MARSIPFQKKSILRVKIIAKVLGFTKKAAANGSRNEGCRPTNARWEVLFAEASSVFSQVNYLVRSKFVYEKMER